MKREQKREEQEKGRNSRFRLGAQGKPRHFQFWAQRIDCKEKERRGKEQKEDRKQTTGLRSTVTGGRSKPGYLR